VVRALETAGGRELVQIAHSQRVAAAAFSPDNKYLVTSSNDRRIRFYGENPSMPVWTVEQPFAASVLSFSPKGTYLAASGLNPPNTGRFTLQFFRMPDEQRRPGLPGLTELRRGGIFNVGPPTRYDQPTLAVEVKDYGGGAFIWWAPQENLIAAGGSFWWVPQGSEQSRVPGMSAVTHDGKYLVRCGGGEGCGIHLRESGQQVARFALEDRLPRRVTLDLREQGGEGPVLSPDGRRLLLGNGRDFGIFQAGDGKIMSRAPSTVDGGVGVIGFSPGANFAFGPATAGGTLVYGARKGDEKSHFRLRDYHPAALSPDGRYVGMMTYAYDAAVVETGATPEVRFHLPERISTWAFSPNGKLLAVGFGDPLNRAGQDWNLSLFSVPSWSLAKKVTYRNPISHLSFSANALYVATASDNIAEVFRMPEGESVRRTAFDKSIIWVACSSDARYVGAVLVGGIVKVIDTRNRREVISYTTGYNSGIVFSPDGRFAAVSLDGQTIEVDRLADGSATGRFGVLERIADFTFGEDSRSIFTLSADAVVRHAVMPSDLLDDGCRRLIRNLTTAEWNSYFPGERYRASCPNLPAWRDQSTARP
jgi:WD40 repeat protein